MRITDISISKGMTVNIGGRNFAKNEVGLTAVLDPTDDFTENLQKLIKLVDLTLVQEVDKVLPKRQTLMESDKKKKRHAGGED